MEPRKPELEKPPQPRAQEKPRRFRIVKLEERIAPGGGKLTKDTCAYKTCGAFC
jgi:hypothetical protein